MLASEYGWTLEEILNLEAETALGLIEVINYRLKAEANRRAVEVACIVEAIYRSQGAKGVNIVSKVQQKIEAPFVRENQKKRLLARWRYDAEAKGHKWLVKEI